MALKRRIAAFLRREDGATAIEYGMIVALIAVGAIVALTVTGNGLTNLFGYVVDESAEAMSSADIEEQE